MTILHYAFDAILLGAIYYAHRTHTDALTVLKLKLGRVEKKLGVEPEAESE